MEIEEKIDKLYNNLLLYSNDVIKDEDINITLFDELHTREIFLSKNNRKRLLGISSKFKKEYIVIAFFNIYQKISHLSLDEIEIDFNNEFIENFEIECENLLKFINGNSKPFQVFNLLNVCNDCFNFDIDEKKARIYFQLIYDSIKNQNFIFNNNDSIQMTINFCIYWGYCFNSKLKNQKWRFYDFARICVLCLAENAEYQAARDLAETIYLLSQKDGIVIAGLYVQIGLYTFQKKIDDSLFYILCFLNEIDKSTPLNILIKIMIEIQKNFRDSRLFDFELKIYDLLNSKTIIKSSNHFFLEINIIHFTTQLLCGKDIARDLLIFLDNEKEKIFQDGIESIIIVYTLLFSTLKYFESAELTIYLRMFKKLINKDVLDNINLFHGKTDNFKDTYNILMQKIFKTRFNEDMISEIRKFLLFLHKMIVNSVETKDPKKFLNSFLALIDLSLERDELDGGDIQVITSTLEEKFDIYEMNWNNFVNYVNTDIEILFIVGVENQIFKLHKIGEEYFIEDSDFSIDSYNSMMNKLLNVVNFKGCQELELDQISIFSKQKAVLFFLDIRSKLNKPICIVRDNTLSSIPFNLIKSDGEYIFLKKPIFSIPTYSFLRNFKRNVIKKNISFWSPLESSDIVLNKVFDKIKPILAEYHTTIYETIDLDKALSSDIDIVIAHGGLNIDKKNTISVNVSFAPESKKYIYFDIDKIFSSPKIILFFVCHSGKISKDYFFEKQNSIITKFFDKGAEVVIAPKWPLNIDILPIWMESFFAAFYSNKSSLESFHLASLKVYEKYKNIGAWGCLHYFGNTDIYIES